MSSRTAVTPTDWQVFYDLASDRRYIVRGGARSLASAELVAEVIEDLDEQTPSSAANAEFIVRCANAHEHLVAALELALTELKPTTQAYRAAEKALYRARRKQA